jgi:hypothetical protein
MVNPLLTAFFDLFLIGSAATIIVGMVQEYLASRRPSVGTPGGHVAIDFSALTSVAPAPRRRASAETRRQLRRVA